MPWWNRDRLWFYLAAAWRCHSRGRVRHGAPSSPHLAFSRSAAREAPDHPGPERGTRRRRLVRAQTISVPKRQAVTAGRGPRSHTKAAGRRFLPPACRRPDPIFLWSEGPFLFPQKKKWSFPPEGLRPRRAGAPRRPAGCKIPRRSLRGIFLSPVLSRTWSSRSPGR